ncbi:MAG: GYD domain-containing protein [Deltaproteobacteria bacterium]|jgi:uncharacterized protein with GYD domain|nr:GYD domain-containing protein [Deltaproteobacteria bacterium]
METYIVLVNFTQQGIAKIKESPAWIDAARQAVEEAGGKWLGWYLTMGRYDVVLIVQAFDSKIIASVMLAIGASGNVRTETLPAFTEEELREMLTRLP